VTEKVSYAKSARSLFRRICLASSAGCRGQNASFGHKNTASGKPLTAKMCDCL
jgi:hypothetical protein